MLLDIQIHEPNMVDTWTDAAGVTHILLKTSVQGISRQAVAWAASVRGNTRADYDANGVVQSAYIALGNGGGLKLVR